ncbi:MAG: hypothetical protein ACJ8DC_01420 [Gemmatimonadales bacterium]
MSRSEDTFRSFEPGLVSLVDASAGFVVRWMRVVRVTVAVMARIDHFTGALGSVGSHTLPVMRFAPPILVDTGSVVRRSRPVVTRIMAVNRRSGLIMGGFQSVGPGTAILVRALLPVMPRTMLVM